MPARKRRGGTSRRPSLLFASSPIHISRNPPSPVFSADNPLHADLVDVDSQLEITWVTSEFGAGIRSAVKTQKTDKNPNQSIRRSVRNPKLVPLNVFEGRSSAPAARSLNLINRSTNKKTEHHFLKIPRRRSIRLNHSPNRGNRSVIVNTLGVDAISECDSDACGGDDGSILGYNSHTGKSKVGRSLSKNSKNQRRSLRIRERGIEVENVIVEDESQNCVGNRRTGNVGQNQDHGNDGIDNLNQSIENHGTGNFDTSFVNEAVGIQHVENQKVGNCNKIIYNVNYDVQSKTPNRRTTNNYDRNRGSKNHELRNDNNDSFNFCGNIHDVKTPEIHSQHENRANYDVNPNVTILYHDVVNITVDNFTKIKDKSIKTHDGNSKDMCLNSRSILNYSDDENPIHDPKNQISIGVKNHDLRYIASHGVNNDVTYCDNQANCDNSKQCVNCGNTITNIHKTPQRKICTQHVVRPAEIIQSKNSFCKKCDKLRKVLFSSDSQLSGCYDDGILAPDTPENQYGESRRDKWLDKVRLRHRKEKLAGELDHV